MHVEVLLISKNCVFYNKILFIRNMGNFKN